MTIDVNRLRRDLFLCVVIKSDVACQHFLSYTRLVCAYRLLQFCTAAQPEHDPVAHCETGILPHALDPADDLTRKAFHSKLRSDLGIDRSKIPQRLLYDHLA